MVINTKSNEIFGLSLPSAPGGKDFRTGDAYFSPLAGGGVTTSQSQLISSANDILGTGIVNGVFNLGGFLPTGLDEAGLRQFLTEASLGLGSGVGGGGGRMDLVVIPEPSGLAMLGLGILMIVGDLRRRRNRGQS